MQAAKPKTPRQMLHARRKAIRARIAALDAHGISSLEVYLAQAEARHAARVAKRMGKL